MNTSISVNGVEHVLDLDPRRLLADVLRDDLGLTGTKLGCAHGACGSCTVHVDGVARRSCLMLAVQAAGRSVTTIECVGAAADELGELQTALWEHGGLQCGFCTPGMVMTALDVIEQGSAVDDAAVRARLSGNLCRCTGYDQIVEAVVSVARSRSAAS